tara:strand:+ start:63 stop:227 length:165 start_codon:yes stop_codon:yes gene_type:complete
MFNLREYGFIMAAIHNTQIKGSDAFFVASIIQKLERQIEKENKKIQKQEANNNK